jgi:hypothetical protein
LDTEFYKEKTDVMIEFGDCGYCALEPSAAASLLDRYSGRYTGDTVYIGTRRRLDKLTGVGIQGLEVAPLSLGKEDIKGNRALPASADSGDDGKSISWDTQIDPL